MGGGGRGLKVERRSVSQLGEGVREHAPPGSFQFLLDTGTYA